MNLIEQLMIESRNLNKKSSKIRVNESFSISDIARDIKVNMPSHADAPTPAYDPLKINESEFDPDYRCKSCDIGFTGGPSGDYIYVDWVAEGSIGGPDKYEFYDEVTRAIQANLDKAGYTDPVEVRIYLSSRSGRYDDEYSQTFNEATSHKKVNESLSNYMRERIENAVMNFDDDTFITDDRAWLDADTLVKEMASEVIQQLYKDSLDDMTNDEAISYAEKVFWDKSSMFESKKSSKKKVNEAYMNVGKEWTEWNSEFLPMLSEYGLSYEDLGDEYEISGDYDDLELVMDEWGLFEYPDVRIYESTSHKKVNEGVDFFS